MFHNRSNGERRSSDCLSRFGAYHAVVGGGDEKGCVGLSAGGGILPFVRFRRGQRCEDALLGDRLPGYFFRAQDSELREAG